MTLQEWLREQPPNVFLKLLFFFGESSSRVDENEPLCAIKVAPLCSVISRGILNEWRNGSRLLAGGMRKSPRSLKCYANTYLTDIVLNISVGPLDVCVVDFFSHIQHLFQAVF